MVDMDLRSNTNFVSRFRSAVESAVFGSNGGDVPARRALDRR